MDNRRNYPQQPVDLGRCTYDDCLAFDDPLPDPDPFAPALAGDDDVDEPSDFPEDFAGELDSDFAGADELDSDEPVPDPDDSDEPPDFSPAGAPLAEPLVTFSRLSLR